MDFRQNRQQAVVIVPNRVVSNAFNARMETAKFGFHLIDIPKLVPASFLEPNLRRVLEDYQIVPKHPIYAVFPDARFPSLKFSGFLDLLVAEHS